MQRQAEGILGTQAGALLAFDLRTRQVRAVVHAATAFGIPAPPGSLMKLVTAAALLESHAIDPHARFRCANTVDIDGRRFTCGLPGGHGAVDLTDALARSCSVYFYTASQRLKDRDVRRAAHLLGLGSDAPAPWRRGRTGRADRQMGPREPGRLLAGVVRGPPEPRISGFRPGLWGPSPRGWLRLDGPRRARTLALVGEGPNIAVTPWQIAVCLQRLVEAAGRVDRQSPSPSADTLSPDTARFLLRAMRAAVISGTAREAALADVAVAGKTGTAEVQADPEKPDAWKERRVTHGWFAGLAPARAPELAVVVFLERGTGQEAARLGRRLLAAGLSAAR